MSGGMSLYSPVRTVANRTGDITLTAADVTGTTTNDNASAGKIGEYVESQIQIGSAIALTNATPANITTITLTAGDWDVSGTIGYYGAASTLPTLAISAINTVSAAIPSSPVQRMDFPLPGTAIFGTDAVSFSIPAVRITLVSPATIYLIGQLYFTVSTATGYGGITARRVR